MPTPLHRLLLELLRRSGPIPFARYMELCLYHPEHGWLYCVGTQPSNVLFWTADMGWLWTSNSQYSYLYRFSDNVWLWYRKNSSDPRWFFNFQTRTWEAR